MLDTFNCPICQCKLVSMAPETYYTTSNIKKKFIVRHCTTNLNHHLMMHVDPSTFAIEYLKFSLDPYFSKNIHIDFMQNTCKVICLKDSKIVQSVNLPKIPELDFPDLISLNQKVSTYLTFM